MQVWCSTCVWEKIPYFPKEKIFKVCADQIPSYTLTRSQSKGSVKRRYTFRLLVVRILPVRGKTPFLTSFLPTSLRAALFYSWSNYWQKTWRPRRLEQQILSPQETPNNNRQLPVIPNYQSTATKTPGFEASFLINVTVQYNRRLILGASLWR